MIAELQDIFDAHIPLFSPWEKMSRSDR